jgi:adenylate cyclase
MDMAEPKRKLVAILSADVAGYSRLMGEDDRATLETLTAHREVMRRHIGEHGGRVIDTPGDALLAEFPSAVEALQSAMDIQAELAERNDLLPENRRMRIRIGVNAGDVLEQEGALYGDGVNIAARLESLADPGGACISSWVYDNVKSKLPYGFENLGKRTVKNIAEPVEVYRVLREAAQRPMSQKHKRMSARRKIAVAAISTVVILGAVVTLWYTHIRPASTTQATGDATSLPLPAQPSLAVLPFQNMSGKADEDWFADGMTETLITDLSRLPNLFVIARNSTFTYKGKPVDVRRVGQELGVRFVLEGSVQRTAERLRVNAQLVEAGTGRHVWAERYDRKAADVFDIQDDIAQRVVMEIDAKLLSGEQSRTWRKTTRNREAYDLFTRANSYVQANSREGMAKGQELLQQAVDLDPKFAMATVGLGWTHVNQGDAGWSPDPKQSYIKAVELGRLAIGIDPSFGDAYALLSNVYLALERHAEAVAAADKAISLSSNQADALVIAAWALALTGRAEEAIPIVQRAFRLNPNQGNWYFGALGDSLLFAKRTKEALVAHGNCVKGSPDFIWCQIGLTVDYAETGKIEEAIAHAKEAVRINPKISADENTYVRSLSIPTDRARVVEALRRAGLK